MQSKRRRDPLAAGCLDCVVLQTWRRRLYRRQVDVDTDRAKVARAFGRLLVFRGKVNVDDLLRDGVDYRNEVLMTCQ